MIARVHGKDNEMSRARSIGFPWTSADARLRPLRRASCSAAPCGTTDLMHYFFAPSWGSALPGGQLCLVFDLEISESIPYFQGK